MDSYLKILGATDNCTLTKWWCELNRWGWPTALGEPEPRDAPHPRRRSAIMDEIMRIVGHKECLREWNNNEDAGYQSFDDWYAVHFRD